MAKQTPVRARRPVPSRRRGAPAGRPPKAPPPKSPKSPARFSRRVVAFFVIAVLVVGGLGTYVVAKKVRADAAAAAAADAEAGTERLDASDVLAVPHLVVRNTTEGPSRGRIALVPLSDPDGPRAILDMTCERVYSTGSAGICLQAEEGLVSGYRTVFLDSSLDEVRDTDLGGLPSRARVSDDGTYAVSTVFVNGHAYSQAGFSTETIVYDRPAALPLANLESYTTTLNGQVVTAEDRNFWGVSFVGDGPTFYATMGTGGSRYLVTGNVETGEITALDQDGACPSVSPDGDTVVFKTPDATTGDDVFVALDRESGELTQLSEVRPVDDQVAWLDDETVMYAVGRGVGSVVDFDIWAAPIDGGPAELLVPDASSPSVVRP